MIDAADFHSCYGRFINDPLDAQLWNSDRYVDKQGNIWNVCTKKIYAGQEIMGPYGGDFYEEVEDANSTCYTDNLRVILKWVTR